MARRAPGPRLCPSPAARAPRGARELLPHCVSTGGTHCLHPWEAGAQAAEGHGPLAPVPHPREAEVPSNPSRSPLFQAPQAALLRGRGSPGDRRQRVTRLLSGPPVRGQDGLRETTEEENQNQTNEKSPPTSGSAAPAKAPVP